MLKPSRRQRLTIAAAGYAVVAIFCIALLVLRSVVAGLSAAEDLILAGLIAAPLALALFREYIKGVKLGDVEITLENISVPVSITLGEAVQEQRSSATPALIKTIAGLIERRELRLLLVNLRSSPYWLPGSLHARTTTCPCCKANV